MASMRKKSGHYYARFYDRRRSPKRKEVALGTTRKDVARRRLTEWERLYASDEFDPWADAGGPEKLAVQDALDAFLEAKSHRRASTRKAYDAHLSAWHSEHVPPGLLLVDVSADHLTPYVWVGEIANATRRGRYRFLRVFLNWAVKQGQLDSSPLAGVRKPKKEKKQAAFLSPDDVDTLLRAIDAHDEITVNAMGQSPDDRWLKHLIHVGVCTGLRRGELLRLRWQDLDLGQRFVTVRSRKGEETKSGNERRVPLRGEALGLLRRLHEERQPHHSEPVFIDAGGKKVKPGRLTQRFKFFVRKAKLPDRERLRFHSLRHTCGPLLPSATGRFYARAGGKGSAVGNRSPYFPHRLSFSFILVRSRSISAGRAGSPSGASKRVFERVRPVMGGCDESPAACASRNVTFAGG